MQFCYVDAGAMAVVVMSLVALGLSFPLLILFLIRDKIKALLRKVFNVLRRSRKKND